MEPKSVTRNMRVFRNLYLSLVLMIPVAVVLILLALGIIRESGHFVWSWQAIVGLMVGAIVSFIFADLIRWDSGIEKANQDFRSIFRVEPDGDRALVQKYVNATLEDLRQKAKAAFRLSRTAWYCHAANQSKFLEYSSNERAEEFRQKEKEFWSAVHVADNHHYAVPDSIDEPIKQLDVYG